MTILLEPRSSPTCKCRQQCPLDRVGSHKISMTESRRDCASAGIQSFSNNCSFPPSLLVEERKGTSGRLVSLPFRHGNGFADVVGRRPPWGTGAAWGRNPSSAAIHCVWVTSLRLPASPGWDIKADVYLVRGEGEGKEIFDQVPMPSAPTCTSWDCIWTEREPCSL